MSNNFSIIPAGSLVNASTVLSASPNGELPLTQSDISTESIEWAQLKEKRDNRQLVPGKSYRIIDYVATTNGNNSSQSANHPFDIIVVADDVDKLNENARAVKNAYDTTYFINTKFEAWKVQYCIDNDISRFAWAVPTVAEGGSTPDAVTGEYGKGIVYHLVDEFGNDVPYDFKGMQFLAYGDNDNVYRYTFDSGDLSNNTDYSVDGYSYSIYNNIISYNISISNSNKQKLNCIVFKGSHCYCNVLENCYSNTFREYCRSNTFKDYCRQNVFGSHCDAIYFGIGCYSNKFGDYCNNIIFGNSCRNIVFKNDAELKNYITQIAVESGNKNIVFDFRGTSSSSAYYRNATVKAGVNDTNMQKTIYDDTPGGQTFHTTFKPANSIEIEVP